eukprot:275377-Prymnesium_polylepis.1
MALVEGARGVAFARASVIVDQLGKLAVGHRRLRHVAHARLHRLHDRVLEAARLLAPRVARGADLRLDIGHLAVLAEAYAARLGVLALAVSDEGVRLGVAQEGVEEDHGRVGAHELRLEVAKIREDALKRRVHRPRREDWLRGRVARAALRILCAR